MIDLLKMMNFHSYVQLEEGISYHHMSQSLMATVRHPQVKDMAHSTKLGPVWFSTIEMGWWFPMTFIFFIWLETLKPMKTRFSFSSIPLMYPYVGIWDMFKSCKNSRVRHWRTSLGPWQRWISLMSRCSRRSELDDTRWAGKIIELLWGLP